MVAGDHPLTAEAIARKVNIVPLRTRREVTLERGVDISEVPYSDPRVEAIVIAGHQVPGLTLEDWNAILSKREVVFARTSTAEAQAGRKLPTAGRDYRRHGRWGS